MIRHTNRLLLEVHQAAKSRDVETFKGWALERLATLVPFRYAIWTSMPLDFDSALPLYSFNGDTCLAGSTERFSGPILPMIAAQAERYAGETVHVSWGMTKAACSGPATTSIPAKRWPPTSAIRGWLPRHCS